jgi:hypothetical protein
MNNITNILFLMVSGASFFLAKRKILDPEKIHFESLGYKAPDP